MRILLLAGCVVLLTATIAQAQTVLVDPTTLQFTVSPDHDTAIVTGYRLHAITRADGTEAIPPVDLGKPTHDAQGVATFTPVRALLKALAINVDCYVQVEVYGPGGQASSAVDTADPFHFTAPYVPPPAPPTSVRVKP